MVHRGTTRESKRLQSVRIFSIEEKRKRHRNKIRIWRRCVKRMRETIVEGVTDLSVTPAPSH